MAWWHHAQGQRPPLDVDDSPQGVLKKGRGGIGLCDIVDLGAWKGRVFTVVVAVGVGSPQNRRAGTEYRHEKGYCQEYGGEVPALSPSEFILNFHLSNF